MSPAVNIAAGSELGTFMLGSTVVTLLDNQAVTQLAPEMKENGYSIKLGENLG